MAISHRVLRLLGFLASFVLLGAPAALAFSDVPTDHAYAASVRYVELNGIMQGYTDGTFGPDTPVNRAEFLTMLYRAYKFPIPATGDACFRDIATKAWYAPVVCDAKERELVKGTSGVFSPGKAVTLVEAAKMIAGAEGALVESPAKQEEWFDPYLRFLEKRRALLPSVGYVSQTLTRAEVAELLWRVQQKPADLASYTAASLGRSACALMPSGSNGVLKADMLEVQKEWLGWYNAERAKVGAPALVLVEPLNTSSQVWAETAKKRGYIDHKRGNNVYYDYQRIKSWFADLGVTFTGKGTTFGESIAWNVYSCSDADCTEELTKAIRSSFNFFAGEKGKAYRPHYDMMINSAYRQIGLGVSVDPVSKKYYLVTHLATGVAGDTLPYCAVRSL